MNTKQAPITPVPLRDVQIQGGIFKDSMEVGRKVLHSLDIDRMLYAFRFQAGLPTLGAKPYESWATPEPYGAFQGFTKPITSAPSARCQPRGLPANQSSSNGRTKWSMN